MQSVNLNDIAVFSAYRSIVLKYKNQSVSSRNSEGLKFRIFEITINPLCPSLAFCLVPSIYFSSGPIPQRQKHDPQFNAKIPPLHDQFSIAEGCIS
ncbi:hypothetical protein HI914_06450 [Erysiphe necator]|nr:hypothetical protein HI914_06450 [Erysiphe necator]